MAYDTSVSLLKQQAKWSLDMKYTHKSTQCSELERGIFKY